MLFTLTAGSCSFLNAGFALPFDFFVEALNLSDWNPLDIVLLNVVDRLLFEAFDLNDDALAWRPPRKMLTAALRKSFWKTLYTRRLAKEEKA